MLRLFHLLQAFEFTVPPHGFSANKHGSLKVIWVEQQSVPDNILMQLEFSYFRMEHRQQKES